MVLPVLQQDRGPSNTVILNACLFDDPGLIEVSAIKDYGGFKFFCNEFKVRISKLLPVSEDNQTVSIIKGVVSILEGLYPLLQHLPGGGGCLGVIGSYLYRAVE